MFKQARAAVAIGGWLIAILALSMIGVVTAADNDRVIQLAVQTDSGMNAFEVENKFKVARDSTQGFNYGEISVDPIDPASYVLLSSIVRRGVLSAPPTKESPRRVNLEPIRGQDGGWWIDLQNADSFLDSAKVTVIDTATEKERVLELEPACRAAAIPQPWLVHFETRKGRSSAGRSAVGNDRYCWRRASHRRTPYRLA